MKNIWKYVALAVVVVLLLWMWLGIVPYVFNGISMENAMIVGVGFFLSFLVVICTGVIIEHIKKH